jgi:DNA-binding MarR family transcriptional regulator
MVGTARDTDFEKTRIMLGLLESVERDGAKTQRRLASELGIALGLVNAYLKRCVKKGLLKVGEAPARRYAYYLTPRGFAEKSQLTVEYLSLSFSLFRHAKHDCSVLFETARARGVSDIAIFGVSDLGEIAAICALDHGLSIVAVVDPDAVQERFVGAPVFKSFDDVAARIDAVIVTDLKASRDIVGAARERFGSDRVLVPELLAARIGDLSGAVK